MSRITIRGTHMFLPPLIYGFFVYYALIPKIIYGSLRFLSEIMRNKILEFKQFSFRTDSVHSIQYF